MVGAFAPAFNKACQMDLQPISASRNDPAMKLLSRLALLAALTLSAQAQDEKSAGFVQRALKSSMDAAKASVTAVKKPFASLGKSKEPMAAELQMEMQLSPEQVKLSETRQIQATILLSNHSKKLMQLEFPTTQRVELTVRNGQGKAVVQWSEEETFTPDPGFVAINPGEHVEYTASLATRDMVAGQLYTIEGFFPKYPQLRAQKLVTPVK